MLALALTLSVLAAPPRGLPAPHSVELMSEVDKRLPKWLTGEGDLKALWATPKELEAYFLSTGVKKPDVAAMVASTVKEQGDKAGLTQLSATRAFIQYTGKAATLHAFDDAAHCEVSLLAVGTEAAQRYVVMGGPRTDTKSFDAVAERLRKDQEMVVFLEKKDGAWSTAAVPQAPPPDCAGVLKNALKTIYTAEKAYFAEKDAYSNSLSKVGVDVKTLGITSAKVSVAGHAPTQTFTIQVGLKGGLMTMDDKGTVLTVADCP